MRSYGAARSLFSIVSLFAWAMIIAGVIGVFAGGSIAGEWARWNRVPEEIGLLLGIVPGIILTVIGFLGLVTAQMGRSGVDSAEYGQQMLQIARDHLEISRQTLHKGEAPRLSFEALSEGRSDAGTASYAGHLGQAGIAADPTSVPPDSMSQPALIAYKGREIAALEQGFHFAGTAFETLSEAQTHIDQLVREDAPSNGPFPRTA
jgi:hypothetical protein